MNLANVYCIFYKVETRAQIILLVLLFRREKLGGNSGKAFDWYIIHLKISKLYMYIYIQNVEYILYIQR